MDDLSIQYDFLLFLFKPNKFLPNIFIINEVGVTMAKKTIPITIGDTKLPNKIPNLNQILFKGLKIDEFNRPNIKKIIASIIAQILILPSSNNGNNEIIRKNAEKTNPKLLLEPISISFLFILILKSVLFFFKLLYFY